jgi:urease accessory protein
LISVATVLGNVRKDEKLREEYQALCKKGQCEKITVSRLESRRARMRKTTDKGTDVGMTLEPGTILRNGDVIYHSNDKMITVELEPENVAVLTFKRENAEEDELFEVAVKIGHAIGNLHRPIKVEGEKVFLPIQADSEMELLNKTFAHILDHLTITKDKMVFEPEEGLYTHEH